MSSGYQHIDACRFTAASIAPLMHADCLNANTTLITDVQIDSRACTKGSLFFALKGEKNDGFSFLSDVCDQGAVAVVVPKSRPKRQGTCELPVLAVDDVLTALHDLAQSYLQRLSSVKTIGITGSCGKSTTKEALSRITAVMGPTAKTPGNLNSEYGLPLSMFGLQEDSRYGVFEMGIDL
jgi:UDP-N-acetylmuramoyl-tripeptide--D-alanyl-D-alanine ligase